MAAQTEWGKGQEAEKEFWKRFTGTKSHFSKQYWAKELENYEGHIKIEDLQTARILEVGCGPKGMIHYIPGREKIGVDPLIEEYKRLKILEDGNVQHVVGVGEHLGFKDESFDIVICFNVLDHSRIPWELVKEMNRVLRKGGRLVFHCHCITSLIRPIRGFLRYVDRPHPWHFTPREIREAFVEANLTADFARTNVFRWQARNPAKHIVTKMVTRDQFAILRK